MEKLKIGIIGGKGKMGQCFKKVFENQGHSVLVSDLHTKISNFDLVKNCQVIIISVPISITPDIIKQIGPLMNRRQLFMDFTSIKKEPLDLMLEHSQCSVLGCHPMFGPTNFIKGQIVIFCPGRGRKWENIMKTVFDNAGALVKKINALEHDKIMAYIQGVNHFISFAFPYTLAKSKIPFNKFLEFQTPVYRIVADFFGRYLDQDPSLYGSIQLSNPENQKAVEKFLETGEEFLKIVKSDKLSKFISFANKGKKYLGNFTKKAQKESDEIIDTLALKIASSHEKNFWLRQPSIAEIALLGPQNTHSHLASLRFFPEATRKFAKTIIEVFDFVENDDVKFGVVPVENIIEGPVNQTLDNLFERKVQILARFGHKIEHSFITLSGAKKNQIKTVYSHAQALSQCQRFLRKEFPHAVQIPTSSTSEAVQNLHRIQDKSCAAIGSAVAAEDSNFNIMFDSIGDFKNNETYFAIIAKDDFFIDSKMNLPQKMGQISVAFDLLNRPGTLLEVLKYFAESKINLTKIQSRPSKQKLGEFIFFVDLEGDLQSQAVKNTLKQVKKQTTVMKILGCW